MLTTERILEHFSRISRIPRCSKHEEQIRQWLLDWAAEQGFVSDTDKVGNLLIRVPASPGNENIPGIVLQAHLDMVCEKTPESVHDFSRDPIRPITRGEWLHAEGTSLGADNGIGIALAMALAEDRKLFHGPLELLFTVDEETGLTGAQGLKPGFFNGRILINLDSEDEGVLTIGCAGGKDCQLLLPLEFESLPAGCIAFKLSVGGLRGGHSGVDIHEQRGNANKILGRVLYRLTAVADLRLASLSGGSAHNAIPREAEVLLTIPAAAAAAIKPEVGKLAEGLREIEPRERYLNLTLAEIDLPGRALTLQNSRRILDLMLAAPHGVTAWSDEVPALVSTSLNFATLREMDDCLSLVFSLRSDQPSELDRLTGQLAALARLAGARFSASNGYPGWQPDRNSPLLAKTVQTYRTLFGVDPKIEVIHAGLECGMIGAVTPGMDMISIGPTIKNPHSPEEKLHIPSLDRICRLLENLVKG